MMSNYSFSAVNARDIQASRGESSSPLELSEKEMQDLADSISPIHSLDSLATLVDQETGEAPVTTSRQQKATEPMGYYKAPDLASTVMEAVKASKRQPSPMKWNEMMSVSSADNKSQSRAQSEAAKERRRERNRLLAKKTRVKNKVEVENLRQEIDYLRSENAALKSSIKDILESASRGGSSAQPMSEPIMNAVKEIVTMMEGSNGASDNMYQRQYIPNQGHSGIYMTHHGYGSISHMYSEQSDAQHDSMRGQSTTERTKSGGEAQTDSSSSFGPQSDDSGEAVGSSDQGSGSGSDYETHNCKKHKRVA